MRAPLGMTVLTTFMSLGWSAFYYNLAIIEERLSDVPVAVFFLVIEASL